MNFYFFDPGTLDPEAGRRGPGCQNLAFQRFDPMILCSFLWRIRWTTLESHSSKQMMVYEQITFFIKSRIFQNLILWWKIDFWAWKQVSGHARTVPDLEKPGKRTEKPEKSKKKNKKEKANFYKKGLPELLFKNMLEMLSIVRKRGAGESTIQKGDSRFCDGQIPHSGIWNSLTCLAIN